MAHSSRTWTGARTPQALKRVRQAARRHAILQPRRSAAKTFIAKAAATAANGDVEQTREHMLLAISALDRAAKVGAIHQNAADRRKSRLMRTINAALGGELPAAGGRAQRQTGKAAAAKAAKARIAATKAVKAKGEQTAAGKARAALSKTTRAAAAASATATANESEASAKTPAKTRTGRTSSTASTKASPAKAPTTKAPASSAPAKPSQVRSSGAKATAASKTTKARSTKS